MNEVVLFVVLIIQHCMKRLHYISHFHVKLLMPMDHSDLSFFEVGA